jgi:hypothetical protein
VKDAEYRIPPGGPASVWEIAPLAVSLAREVQHADWYSDREFYIGVIERVNTRGETPQEAGAALVHLNVDRLIAARRLVEQHPWLAEPCPEHDGERGAER